MRLDSPESTGQRTQIWSMQTSVPLVWRERLAYLRAAIGVAGTVLFIWHPAHSWLLTVALAAYAAYSVYLSFSHTGLINQFPMSHLALDTGAFLAISVHPTEPGIWTAVFAYFFLLFHAGLLYHWTLVSTVVIGVLAFVIAVHPRPTYRMWPAFALGGGLGIVLSVQRRLMENRLSFALRRAVLSRSEAELAREEERQRIAADFHDGPLQSFISFQMRLEIIRKLMARNPETATRELVTLQEIGRAQVNELRAFLRGMQPAEVTPTTLTSAIREAVEHFERDSGITTELFCGDLSKLEESITLEVLQIIREILNNTRKHSKASRIRLEVDADTIQLRIRAQDDGSGFPFSGAYTLEELEVLRMGPRSIQRRVRTLGGDLLLESRPTEGASISVQIPVSR